MASALPSISVFETCVRKHAAKQARASALRGSHRDRSWLDLLGAATQVADCLTRHEVSPGAAVAIATADLSEFLPAFIGAKIAGAIPAIVEPNPHATTVRVLQTLRPAAVISGAESTFSTISVEWSGARFRCDSLGGPPPSSTGQILSYPGLLCFTSGSTGPAKGVLWSDDRVSSHPATRGDRKSHCVALLLPPASGAGLYGVMKALLDGSAILHIPTALAVAAAFEEMAVHSADAIRCTAIHQRRMLQVGLSLPKSIQMIFSSGSRLAAEELQAFVDFAGEVEVVQGYGLSEIGRVAQLKGEELRNKAHTVGRPLEGRRVEIATAEGDRATLGDFGEIIITVADFPAQDGYFQPDSEMLLRFAEGRLRTRDYGRFDEDGYLILEARSADLLNIGGRLVSAHRIEDALSAVDGIAGAAVVAMPHSQLGEAPVAIYCAADSKPVTRSIVRDLRETLSHDEVPRIYLPRRRLPLNTAGKLLRSRLAEEARDWSNFWPLRLAFNDALWPARLCAASGRQRAYLIDGCQTPPAACPPETSLSRHLTVVRQSETGAAVGWAAIQDGTDSETAGVRLIWGPRFDPMCPSFALVPAVEAIVEAACRLPGPDPRAVVSAGGDARVTDILLDRGFAAGESALAVLEFPVAEAEGNGGAADCDPIALALQRIPWEL